MAAPLHAQHTAVLFIDFQVDVCARGGRMISKDDAVIARFEAARQAASRVLVRLREARGRAPAYLHVCHGFQPGYPELGADEPAGLEAYIRKVGAFVRGDPGTAIVPELSPAVEEVVVWKQGISAFVGTDVLRWLTARSIRTVVIAGVVTHYAVMAAAISAHDHGYRTIVLRDCCASGDPARHEAALEILAPLATVMDSADFLAAW